MEKLEQTRSERRGRSKSVFNNTFNEMRVYRLSNRGVWIMNGNLSAPHLHKNQMNKIYNN